ncbi:pyridoxal-phosphate dependent enzyme [Niastella caeni]|uniref:Pyridoxal-phosphate dependent enzyme n=1 Tax=Niastella caeni TaxID=2569763 RepID=A0A4S8HXK4_9BACT|nr:pyridoxal-phosphate dependent enzyme [Niastella caeni]THU40021.1 pyridoxal-phosphate dependent enzyme [Niastella caeni]
MNKVKNQPVDLTKAVVQPLTSDLLQQKNVSLDVLRLDLIHPVISGNKWFKLKYHIREAQLQNKKGILTFGGAWSNHLVATALACHQAGLASIGIIRGEQPARLSDTLQEVQQYNMQLQFVSRAAYSNEAAIGVNRATVFLQEKYPEYFIVPQGGQSHLGVLGAAEILQLTQIESYSHISCAAGTGTMLAGLVHAALPYQQVIGICSLKLPSGENNSLCTFVKPYAANLKDYTLFYDYHFGGYARKTDELIRFMNTIYLQHDLPTDFVYTGKLFFGILQLVQMGYFQRNSRILVVHSGGLQGNRSLPAGTLTFL